MSTFTRAEASAIRTEVQAAVEQVLAKRGLNLAKASASYYEEVRLTFIVEKLDVDERGINMASPAVTAYGRYAAGYGLPEDGIGRTFTYRGATYTVTGLNPAARSFPITAIGPGGPIRFAAETVKRGLAAA